VAVASAGPYANQHLVPDRRPRQHPTTQFFTGQMPFLLPNQQRQSSEGINKMPVCQYNTDQNDTAYQPATDRAVMGAIWLDRFAYVAVPHF